MKNSSEAADSRYRQHHIGLRRSTAGHTTVTVTATLQPTQLPGGGSTFITQAGHPHKLPACLHGMRLWLLWEQWWKQSTLLNSQFILQKSRSQAALCWLPHAQGDNPPSSSNLEDP